MYRPAGCWLVDPAVPCTWGHAGPPHGPRRRPRTPFWAFSLLKKPFGRIRAAAAGPDVHGRGWDRKVRPVPFYPYPRRAPPTSSAGAAAAAVGLGGLFKSACPTSSARRPAPLAAVCKPGTPLDRSIYGDHTSHSGLHLPRTRRRPPRAPFHSTLPVGHTHGRHPCTHIHTLSSRRRKPVILAFQGHLPRSQSPRPGPASSCSRPSVAGALMQRHAAAPSSPPLSRA